MQINSSFDFAADTPQAERTNFVNAVNTVIGYFDSLFTNDVTINVKFALGERLQSHDDTTITYERMADINAPGSLLGASNTQYDIFDYATVRNRLLTRDRKSTRLNSSHQIISYAVFCLKKKKK